jgi:hypothetical protein
MVIELITPQVIRIELITYQVITIVLITHRDDQLTN